MCSPTPHLPNLPRYSPPCHSTPQAPRCSDGRSVRSTLPTPSTAGANDFVPTRVRYCGAGYYVQHIMLCLDLWIADY